MPTSPCLTAALEYVQRGWSALALCPPDHAGPLPPIHIASCNRPGKAPPWSWKTFQHRLPTAKELLLYFDRNSSCNVGIVLGAVSGLVGLDIDGPEAEALLQEISGGDLPSTLEFRTPGGGRRLLYPLRQGLTVVRQRFDGGSSHVIILGEGCLTVMPPSQHANGGEYIWEYGCRPGEIDRPDCAQWPPDCPQWLLANRPNGLPGGGDAVPHIFPPPDLDRRYRRARAYLATIPGSIQGQDGSKPLWTAACKLVGKFLLSRDLAIHLLATDFNPRCQPPWSPHELDHAVGRALTNHTEIPVNDDPPAAYSS